MNDSIVRAHRIEEKIFIIHGQRVMLDKDLAELYGVKARRLREQVKRNKEKFPLDFMFQLTEIEVRSMVSQNATPSKSYFGGHLPYAFTEHGALMLSSVLNSKRAAEISIFIVRAFIKMREMLSANKDLILKIDNMEKKYDKQFKIVFDAIRALIYKPIKKTGKIGFLADRNE